MDDIIEKMGFETLSLRELFPYGRARGEEVEINGQTIYFKSQTEVKFARILDRLREVGAVLARELPMGRCLPAGKQFSQESTSDYRKKNTNTCPVVSGTESAVQNCVGTNQAGLPGKGGSQSTRSRGPHGSAVPVSRGGSMIDTSHKWFGQRTKA